MRRSHIHVAAFALAFCAAAGARAEAYLPDLSKWEFWEAQTTSGSVNLKLRINEPAALRSGGFRSLVRLTAENEATEERGSAVAEIQAPDLATLFGGGGMVLLEAVLGTDPATIARLTGITLTPVRVTGSLRFLSTLQPCVKPWIASTLEVDGGEALGARAAVIARQLGFVDAVTWGLINPCWLVVTGRDSLAFTVTAEDGSPLGGVTVTLVSPTAAGDGVSIVSGITAPDGTLGLTQPPDPIHASVITSPSAIPLGSLVPPGPSTIGALSSMMAQ